MIDRKKIFSFLPLLFVIVIVFTIAVKNIVPGTYFSGWDNSHPELNLTEFTKRVFSGAWVEFQGTGAPASQSQLAEIPRLPFIYLLKMLVPDNLNRYIFTFLMVLIGGIGMYYYLTKIWLTKIHDRFRNWIASFGAIYYILNIITLQQFFINFELFAVQFAYFPFVLLSIHAISNKCAPKTVLLFIGVLLLFAPCAYVPTIFYIAFVFFTIYTFFVNLQIQKNIFKTVKMTGFIVLIIFIVNSFWMLPNLYYTFHNAHYVKESRTNQTFDMEALWSVREAGAIENFLTGIHFIFNWKDYNFKTSHYEFIYEPWNKHLTNNTTLSLLAFFNLLSIAGFVSLLFDSKRGIKRWGMIWMYIFTTVFIWIGFFLPSALTNFIYKFGLIQEAFRNPFTKLSNFYSFVVTIMLCSYIEQVTHTLKKSKHHFISTFIPTILLFVFFISLVYTAWPSFKGNFLNDKLRIKYPSEYFEMFSYLKTKPTDARVLELPFLSDDGWLLYSWPSQGVGNGYQGMGFYLFGIPQPLMTPDHARWTESTDFFYHELRQAINSQNAVQLQNILEKYHINLIVVDETSMWKYKTEYDYTKIHQILTKIGYSKIWNKNFLSIYEVPDQIKKGKLLVPKQVNFVSSDTKRIRRDYVYENIGEYVATDENKADLIFPFINLTSLQLSNVSFKNDRATTTQQISKDDYSIKIPGIQSDTYSTVAQISYSNQRVQIIFPKTKVVINSNEYLLPQFNNITVDVGKNYDNIILWFNEKMLKINKNQTINPVVFANVFQPIEISYAGLFNNQVNLDTITYSPVKIAQPIWATWKDDLIIHGINVDNIQLKTEFPVITADLGKFPSENCSEPQRGKINSSYKENTALYTADEYGVNCNHYNFEYLTPDYSYLLHLSGKNYEGRSIKFFIDYNIKNTLPEEYLMSKNKFDTTLSLIPVTTYATKPYAINWETRSYGKTSKNELSEMQVIPFPIDRLSQIQIQKNDAVTTFNNQIKINNTRSYATFLYFINTDCNSNQCYIGINQAYDDLWMAIDSNLNVLPHYRYNNWANLWQFNSNKKIIIIYIPQVISLVCLIGLIVAVIILFLQLTPLL